MASKVLYVRSYTSGAVPGAVDVCSTVKVINLEPQIFVYSLRGFFQCLGVAQ